MRSILLPSVDADHDVEDRTDHKDPKRRKDMDASKAAVDHTFKAGRVNQDVLTRLYNETRFIEPLVTKDVAGVSAEQGNHLEGRIYAVKTASSVESKLERDEEKFRKTVRRGKIKSPMTFDAVQDLSTMKDLIRYTEICPHDKIVPTTQETIRRMEERGYIFSGARNYYTHPFSSTGYKGIHLNFITPYGQEIELQVHSQISFDAKQQGHALYEQMRSVSVRPEVKDQLRGEALAIHGAVPNPPGYALIVDFSLDEQTKKSKIEERRARVNVLVQNKTSPDGLEETTTYRVQVESKDVHYGFEHKFPDGSVWACHATPGERGAHFYELMANGEQVKGTKVRAHPSFSIGTILKTADKQKEGHRAWMDMYFPEGNLEAELDITPAERLDNAR